MYLCNCNGLSERAVREAIEPRADGTGCAMASVSALFEGFGCRPRCGKCVGELRLLVEEAQARTRVAMAAE